MDYHCKKAILLYEDRCEYEIGLKIVALSLLKYTKKLDVHVFTPEATEKFKIWSKDYPQLTIHLQVPTNQSGWNVKPDLLLWGIASGYEQIVWLDSDIVLTQNIEPLVFGHPQSTLVISEVPFREAIVSTISKRSQARGLEPSNKPWQFNRPSACCIGVSKEHLELLNDWKHLLQSEQYLHCRQSHNVSKLFYGDDAALQALLGSRKYEDLDIAVLRNGQDIAQCLTLGSFNCIHRLKCFILGYPSLIHSMGPKPWEKDYLESHSLSIYSLFACEFADQLGSGIEQAFLIKAKKIRTYYEFLPIIGLHLMLLVGFRQAFFINITGLIENGKRAIKKIIYHLFSSQKIKA